MTTRNATRTRYDAVIVGARCAGAAIAMLLARAGLRVLAIDRSQYGSDTLSTHALMRAGVIQLHRWGLLDAVADAGTPAVKKTSFHYAEEVNEVSIKSRDGVDALYAPRRTVLDALLVDAARAAGAEFLYQARLLDLLRAGDGRVHGVTIAGPTGEVLRIDADMVIGADGRHSTVARLAGAEPYRTATRSSGVIYGYWSGLDVDGYHWYYRPEVSLGAIPTNDGQTCVFVATSTERFHAEIGSDVRGSYGRLLTECAPELSGAMESARVTDRLRGFAGELGYMRHSHGPGWALVGDAGYFKDPITAHGMTDALRDAELLARAVVSGTENALAEYQTTRDDLSLAFFEATDRVASYEWDLESVRETHLKMSEEMKRECAFLTGLGAVLDLDRSQTAHPLLTERDLTGQRGVENLDQAIAIPR